MPNHLKSSKNWLKTEKHKKLQIIDPDGWDRKNLEESMLEKITEKEFNKRVMRSTILLPTYESK